MKIEIGHVDYETVRVIARRRNMHICDFLSDVIRLQAALELIHSKQDDQETNHDEKFKRTPTSA